MLAYIHFLRILESHCYDYVAVLDKIKIVSGYLNHHLLFLVANGHQIPNTL